MSGLSRHTAEPLSNPDHLRQSVEDILTTPLGSRVMRRDYGSRLPDLIDQPLNAELRVDIFAATAEALAKDEPRLVVRRVRIETAVAGQMSLSIYGEDNFGEPLSLEDIAL